MADPALPQPAPLHVPSTGAVLGLPAEFSNAQARRVLLALLFFALLPRAVLAWRLNAVCDDAYFYQWAATMWEQGRTVTALKYLNVNVYPWILWGLNAAGLPWPLSGKLWGVVVSSLAVLPLFGLMRRLFDDRVAAVSAFLYAIHPRLIELSAEPIREPTFWFLFVLSAYWIHRAATSSRGWFHPLAAGIATALAVHTRTEGWALLVLLFAWPMMLAPAHTSWLRRLSRIALALAMIPAFLIVTNLTLLRDHDRWEWGRFAPLRGFVEWLQPLSAYELKPEAQAKGPAIRPSLALQASMGGPFASGFTQLSEHPGASALRLMGDANVRRPSEAVAAFAQLDGPGRPSYGKPAAYVFVNSFAEKLGYVNLVFLLIGSLCCGRELLDRRRLPLLVVFGGILLAVWVRLSQFGDINGRYFLTAYLIALPTEAAGLLFVMQRLQSRYPWRTLPASACVPAVLLLMLTTAFWFKAFTKQHSGREEQARLGRQIREYLGPCRLVEVDRPAVRVGHFALGRLPSVQYDDEGDGPPLPPPDVIITTTPLQPSVRERAKRHGLVEIPPTELNASATDYHIFARPALAGHSGVGEVN